MSEVVLGVQGWRGWGTKFPQVLSFLIIYCCSFLAALILSDNTSALGSAIAICFALPAVFLFWQAMQKPQSRTVWALFTGLALSLSGIALEPGWLSIATGWFLLTAVAITLRGSIAPSLYRLSTAFFRSASSAPVVALVDATTALGQQPLRPRHLLAIPVTALLLPAVTGVVFALLLGAANPVIELFLMQLRFGNLLDAMINLIFSIEIIVFAVSALALWPILRGRTLAKPDKLLSEIEAPLWHRVFFKPLAVTLTLLLLNAMFAIENLLDLQHVWFANALPQGFNHAQYVHRGAYTLIATAILAGLLMVFALRQGTSTAQSGLVRKLVYLWTAQNLLLVASSAKRTFSYIDAYGWTEWRLAGLIWMALVFFGLITIAWRVLHKRDAHWLININLLATFVVLLCVGAWNTRGTIAEYNVDRALAGRGLDTKYLVDLGPTSLPALRRLQRHYKAVEASSLKPREAAIPLRQAQDVQDDISLLELGADIQQSTWQSWTLRNAFIMAAP